MAIFWIGIGIVAIGIVPAALMAAVPLAKEQRLIDSASQVLHELRSADFRLDDKIIRDSLVRIVAKNGKQ